MANWKEVIAQIAVDAEEHFDLLKYRLRERLGGRDPIMILPFRGFGTQEKLYLKGRVLEDKGITSPEDNDSIWDNLVNMYKRFESDEIPYARVRVNFQDIEKIIETDEEGYFEVWIEPDQPLDPDKLWHSVYLELIKPDRDQYPPVKAKGQVMVPPAGARFGVISDIDDTVLKTDATHLLNMARTVFLGNARTRLPFPGVAAFYRALLQNTQNSQRADRQKAFNPLFYVSSSPWNIYDLLSDFFHLQDIPLGPVLFLRDWGISEDDLIPSHHHSYKLGHIRKIMDLYQDLPFILIGDSGQEDPEIYAEVVDLYPERILAIYIRNVSRGLKRPEAIHKLAKQVAESGSSLILAEDTLPMAEHAAEHGWISPQDLPEIRAEIKADIAPPGPLESLLEEQAGEQEQISEPPKVVVDADDDESRASGQAIDSGAIEKALEQGDQEDDQPPTVIVNGDED
jgi:phosphatidate phosphatase APP1